LRLHRAAAWLHRPQQPGYGEVPGKLAPQGGSIGPGELGADPRVVDRRAEAAHHLPKVLVVLEEKPLDLFDRVS